MSEVAGRMSIQVGAYCLQKAHGGLGMLLGGVPGVEPAKVVILGGGVVGYACGEDGARHGRRCLGARPQRRRPAPAVDASSIRPLNTVFSTRDAIEQHVSHGRPRDRRRADPGAAAPKLVRRELIAKMKPGSVVVDVAIDQGGCFETSRPTTHADPTYVVDGVIHYCVANMPGAVPRTSTFALTNATLPFVLALAGAPSRPLRAQRGPAAHRTARCGSARC
jgi:alanine dehydrogenase